MAARNVFTIPPGADFLDTLVGALFDGRLIAGFRADDPFALVDTTLYLPTRRAARAIRERFLDRLGRPVLLPQIRTLGDIDEDEAVLFEGAALDLPPAVPTMERQLVLTDLVLRWSGAAARALAGLPGEELLVPSSPADAARFAASLGQLIDQVGTTREAWAGLFADEHGDLARFWQITLEFLRIATEFWPARLDERGMIDPGVRRDRLIRAEARRLGEHGAAAPVIAAGSTGSVPATAALLKAIAALPNGAVVLPGLDQDLDEESWEAIGEGEDDPAAAGHPQFGLKKLLEGLGAVREAVVPLAAMAGPLAARSRLVSEAMRPAATTDRWSMAPAEPAAAREAAVAGIGIVEAANEREEGLAVAALLRSAAEEPGKVAALVTPDRGLARRVAVELQRWGIVVDDSAGRPLAVTPPGVLARLVATAALNGAAADTLLALLKHPLTALGLDPAATRRAARSLERAVLRGPRLRAGSAALRHALAGRARDFARDEERPTNAARDLSHGEWEAAEALAAALEAALTPLERMAAAREAPLAALVEAHIAALRAVARPPEGEGGLFAEEAGEALADLLDSLRASAATGPAIAPADYPGLFTALLERQVVRPRGGTDPRIHIWGALEARLQRVDLVVLGGLNEGTWPGQTRLDPLLSRPMRAALALEPPERRIGLAAHDFAQALGHAEVWLTRAAREDGEPKVASRWLQRLTAYAGEDLTKAMLARGAERLAWARGLDAEERRDPPVRPRPSPPVALRPRQLSVTQIETLIRDPYAIYARRVLRLAPFEPLAKLPDARERGTLIHDILEELIAARPRGPFDAAAEAELLAIGRRAFDAESDFPEFETLLWPRFERIARWLVRTEAAWTDVAERRAERRGSLAVTTDFTLTARADRVDALIGGGLAIIDYKTGTPPSMNEVLSLSPQLPLEALIARAGGFEGIEPAEPERLAYYRLSGRGEGGELCDRSFRPSHGGKDAVTLDEALAVTEQRLAELVAYFAGAEAEYVSQKIPKPGRSFVGDYDHLARIAEWATSEAEEE